MPVVNSITSVFIDLWSTGERVGWMETGVFKSESLHGSIYINLCRWFVILLFSYKVPNSAAAVVATKQSIESHPPTLVVHIQPVLCI